MQLKALLLDLDGTLIDTAPDMVAALNRVLESQGQPPVDLAEASLHVSNGARGLLEFGFAERLDQDKLPELIEQFLQDYQSHLADLSRPYDGILETLEVCKQAGIPWGVVTNKKFSLSRELLDKLGLLEDCRILVGGDSLSVSKPHPAPLLHCCMTLSLAGSECLYVGDHERDIQAGKAAGMDTAVALWGYIQDHHKPEDWRADYLLRQPSGLQTLINEKVNQKAFTSA